MNLSEKSVEIHRKNYNCAQCVLKACKEFYPEVPDELLVKIAAGFGGGVCCGEICGALTGGVMAVGLSTEFDESNPESILASKNNIKAIIKNMNATFKNNFDSLLCSELKGGKHSCKELIAYGTELTEKTIRNIKGQEKSK